MTSLQIRYHLARQTMLDWPLCIPLPRSKMWRTGSTQEKDDAKADESRWNGKVIAMLGDRYMEVEERLADFRPAWLGKKTSELLEAQVDMMDVRGKKEGIMLTCFAVAEDYAFLFFYTCSY